MSLPTPITTRTAPQRIIPTPMVLTTGKGLTVKTAPNPTMITPKNVVKTQRLILMPGSNHFKKLRGMIFLRSSFVFLSDEFENSFIVPGVFQIFTDIFFFQ